MKIIVNQKTTALAMFAVVFVLMLLCGITQFFVLGLGHRSLMGSVPLFDVGKDANIPTWWSSMALMFCALLMTVIGLEHRSRGDAYVFWWVLAATFCFISLDEVAMIHERVGNEISVRARRGLGVSAQYGGATWIYAYIIPGMILAISSIRFYLRLPFRTRVWLMVSALTLVGGGMGVETIAHAIWHPEREWLYQIMTMLEEFLEMLGVVFLAYALIDYIVLAFGGLSLNVEIGKKPLGTAIGSRSRRHAGVESTP